MNNYDKVINDWVNAHNMTTFTGERTVEPDHVFDENQSVKWNREMAAKHNADVEFRRKDAKEQKYKAIKEATENAIKFIAEDNNVSYEQAEKVFKYVESNFNDCNRLQHIICHCEDILELFDN